MNIINAITQRNGLLTPELLRELASEYPDCAVFLKRENGSLSGHTASNAAAVLASNPSQGCEILANMEAVYDAAGEFYLAEISL